MHCTNCGARINEGARFCKSCGKPVVSGPAQAEVKVETVAPVIPITTNKSVVTIKCGNCGYVGEGQPARRLVFQILAWCCVFFAPLITIIYYLGTHKYKCPKCSSTFVGVKNMEGAFVGQRGGSRTATIIFVIIVGIAIIGILSSVVLASLNAARQKAAEATSEIQENGWQTYNSVADGFSILFPGYPTYESELDTSTDLTYSYRTYSAEQDTTSFFVARYVYEDEIDVSDPDDLLERFLNGFVDGTGGQLSSSYYAYLDGYRALHYHIDVDGSENIKGAFVLVGQTPFLIVEDYYTQNYDDAEHQRFINSFSVN